MNIVIQKSYFAVRISGIVRVCKETYKLHKLASPAGILPKKAMRKDIGGWKLNTGFRRTARVYLAADL